MLALGTIALGFATSTRALVVVAFAVLFVGLAEAVRTLVAVPVDRVTTEAVNFS